MPTELDYWRLCTDFTIVQAALIICGRSPDDLQWDVERRPDCRPRGYVAVKTALCNAITSGRLSTSDIRFELDSGGDPTRYLDIHGTTIHIEEIDRFLKSSGMVCDFFDRAAQPLGLSQADTPKLPPKLSAAVQAWTAVTNDPARLRGRSPKQALEEWLVENAKSLGLLNKAGEPNRTGIEEICKVANWKPEGGATPTPGRIDLPVAAKPLRLPSMSDDDPPPWDQDDDAPLPF